MADLFRLNVEWNELLPENQDDPPTVRVYTSSGLLPGTARMEGGRNVAFRNIAFGSNYTIIDALTTSFWFVNGYQTRFPNTPWKNGREGRSDLLGDVGEGDAFADDDDDEDHDHRGGNDVEQRV